MQPVADAVFSMQSGPHGGSRRPEGLPFTPVFLIFPTLTKQRICDCKPPSKIFYTRSEAAQQNVWPLVRSKFMYILILLC